MQKLLNSTSFLLCALLIIVFSLISSAYAGCTHFSGADKPICRKATKNDMGSTAPSNDPTGLYTFYRFANSGEGQRRCRLHPTCSYFTVRAVKEYGFFKGLLYGLARAQMEHSSQDGHLVKSVADDGRFIYLDPLESWAHAPYEN